MNYKIKEFPDTMTVKIYSGEKKKQKTNNQRSSLMKATMKSMPLPFFFFFFSF